MRLFVYKPTWEWGIGSLGILACAEEEAHAILCTRWSGPDATDKVSDYELEYSTEVVSEVDTDAHIVFDSVGTA